MDIFAIVRSAIPVLDTVTSTGLLSVYTNTEPKSNDVGITSISGVGGSAVPVPDRETLTGFSSGSLDGMDNVPDWGPAAEGVKTSEILAELPGVRVSPDIFPLAMAN